MSIPKKVFSKNKIWTMLTILSFLTGIAFVYLTGENMKQSALKNDEIQKKIKSQLAITSFKKEIDKFALLVLGIRNQVKAINHIPDALELQSFLRAQVEGMNFHDSLVISYLDTNHVFQYSITKTTINPNNLTGESVKTIRDSAAISQLNDLFNTDDLLLFPPLNLVEGWVGIPLNFRLQKNGKTVGYFAPIIDFKSIIDEVYQQHNSKDFVYKFSYNNELIFDRHAVYDGTKIYNNLTDPEFYQKFDKLSESDFLVESFSCFGVQFYIGIAYKENVQLSTYQYLLLCSWYFIIIFFFLVVWIFSYWQYKKKLELKRKREQLLNYVEALERFTFAASHDLKEPLRTIGSFSSLLQRRYQNILDETGNEYLGFIKRNIARMSTLLEDLLKYAQIINSDEIPKEKIAFNDIVKEVQESLLTSIKESNTQLIVADTFPIVYVNKMQIYQLVQNLVSNAIKFNDKEFRQVQIGFEKHQEQNVFFVKDNGIGISKEFYNKIFDTFQQLNKSNYKGSGIGLAICKKIVEQNNGKIWLESEKGNGTTFYFSLPSSS